jgi:N-acetylglutamate synthase-like GNAT family acetyltransferase
MIIEGSEYILRPARAEDDLDIRKLIHQVGINPLGLQWERFVLAVDRRGIMIGCGQIKKHGDGSLELASIAVVEGWRSRGVASAIICHLLEAEHGRLYLTCREELGPFYLRFGFRQSVPDELPPYFRRLSRLARILRFLHLMPAEGLLIMFRDEPMKSN